MTEPMVDFSVPDKTSAAYEAPQQILPTILDFAFRRAGLTALTLVAFILALAGGLARLEINNSARVFMAASSPEKLALDELEATYSKDENVIFAIVPPEGETVQSPQTLKLVRTLTDELWKAPYVRKAVSLVNFVDPISDASGESLLVDDLVPVGSEDDPAIQNRLTDFFEQRPDVLGNIVSRDMKTTAVFWTVSMPSEHLDAVKKVALHARDLRDKYMVDYPGYDIHVTGLVMLDYALTEASEVDSGSLVPIMLVFVLALVGLLFRSMVPVLAVLIAIVLSLLGAIGAVGWAGFQINTASSAAPLIILIIAVANAVHIITTTHKTYYADSTVSADEIVQKAVAFNLRPLILTNLTTVLGFATLNFSDVIPFGELGTVAAIGILISLVVNLTLVPFVLRWWIGRRKTPLAQVPAAVFDGLADMVFTHHKWLFFVFLMLAVTALLGLRLLVFNDNYVEYFDTRNDFRTQTELVQNVWGGMGLVEYSFEAPEGKTVANPDYLRKLDGFAKWLREQPHVNSVIALPDQISRLNEAFNNIDLPPGTVPDDPELTAQLLSVFEISAPYGHSLTDRITPDYQASRVSVMTDNISSQDTIALETAAAEWLRENAPELAETPGTGLSLAFSYVSKRNNSAMMTGNIISILGISILLGLAWRSFSMGVFSLLPNLLPIAIVLGFWGYFISEINLAVSIVGVMVLGIVVDDTVYILTKFIKARRSGLDTKQSIRAVYSGVGLSLVATTTVIAAGFAVLATSSFAINANLGLLALSVVIIALIYDLLFVPTVLLMTVKDTTPAPSTHQ